MSVASNFNSVKWKLSETEALDPQSRNVTPHKLSPLSFVRMGLELEDQQCVPLNHCGEPILIFSCPCRQQVIVHLASKGQRTDLQKLEVQERRNVLARRITLWRTAQVIYMPPASEYLAGERDLLPSDGHEFDESKPELWPLLLPSQVSRDDVSLCHSGIAEIERTLRLAQAQDSLVDLRRLRRTLRSLKTYFRSNVVGEGQKVQTKSRTAESGVTARIGRTVHRYRLAYTALLSLDPTGEWRNEYLELTDKDNRGPGKEVEERGVGDGRYTISWIWKGSFQDGTHPPEQEVNNTVRHEWMTCRARADRWQEESDLLQEEMRRVVAFLEWKSMWWSEKVGARLGSITADVQHGINGYARKQASIYHKLAASLAHQWIPHLLTLDLDISWAKTYPWANGSACQTLEQPVCSSGSLGPLMGNKPLSNTTSLSQQDGGAELAGFNSNSEDESCDDNFLEVGNHDEGESSDGFGIGFEHDDYHKS